MGKQFKMEASALLIAFSVIFSFCDAQITVGDNDRPNAPSEGDVDSRFFNIDFGNISLGGVAETAIGTTLGQLGTGFLQDCLGIGKRSCYNDNRCYNTCDKCYQGYNNYNTGGFSGNTGGSSNFGSSNSNFGSSNSNYGNSNSGSGYTNCNS